MKTFLAKTGLALALGATALTAAAPAEAQRYGGGYRGGHDGTGAAIVAGLAGLAIGAVIASSNNHRDGYYDDRGAYDRRGYDRARIEYARRHQRDCDHDREQAYRGGYGYQQGGYQQGGYDQRGYDQRGYDRDSYDHGQQYQQPYHRGY